MTRPGPRRPFPLPIAPLPIAIAAALCLVSGFAAAETVDCSALRAAIDAAGPADDPAQADPAQADAALRRQRDEILRTRDDANRTGCGDGFFDDPDSAPCRSLARRIGMLQVELQRMQDRVARGGTANAAEDRRRDLQARFDAACAADPDDAPATTMPADPDAPPGPAAKPRAGRVLCVRHCDGAFYPLATDVAPDRMGDMDRICQAQCPSAESSAYADDGGDVSGATATDGSPYSALPAAFGYLKGRVKACDCRAPHQSWAEALAGAEALLPPHKGDVTVTADLAATMAQPSPAPRKPVPAAAGPGLQPSKKAKPKAVAPPTAPMTPSGLDLMREFRGSDPTL